MKTVEELQADYDHALTAAMDAHDRYAQASSGKDREAWRAAQIADEVLWMAKARLLIAEALKRAGRRTMWEEMDDAE